jgi:hypothetical protein
MADCDAKLERDHIRCRCGSGKQCRNLSDARGNLCGFVCDDCEARKRERFHPEVFTNPLYEEDEEDEEDEGGSNVGKGGLRKALGFEGVEINWRGAILWTVCMLALACLIQTQAG